MAAGGFKVFTTDEVLSSADTNNFLMQGVLVFADAAARDAAITSPQEGQFAFTKDDDSLWYYSGSAWVASGATGDIEGVTAGVGISGGGTSGTVTITNSMATTIDAAGDIIYGTGNDAFTKLSIGTAGQVLKVNSGATAPEWGAAGGGGANWSLLNTGGTALTGAATITISGISGVDKIMVLVSNASSASASSIIGVRLNADTGNNYRMYGADYIWGATYINGNYETTAATQAEIRLGRIGTSAANILTGFALITGCNASGVKVYNSTGHGNGTNGRSFIAGGLYTGSSTISSVSLFSDTGNFDAGTVFVYTSA